MLRFAVADLRDRLRCLHRLMIVHDHTDNWLHMPYLSDTPLGLRAPGLRERSVARGLRLIRATWMHEDFRRHTHQSVLVGLVTRGRRTLDTPQGRHDFGPGDGFAIPPGLVHWCTMPEAHSYRVALVAPEHWNALAPQPLTTLRRMASGSPEHHALRRLLACLRWNGEPMAIDECLVSLALALADPTAPAPSESGGISDALIAGRVERVRTWLEQHCSDPVDLQTLAELAGCSAGTITRQFAAAVGLPPYEYVVQLRLRRAATVLREGQRSIADIALEHSFADQSHFQRFFRRAYGVTPLAYRQSAQRGSVPPLRVTPAPD